MPEFGPIGAREFWTLVHGMGLGALFLLAFAGGLAGLYSLKTKYVTPAGLVERVRRLEIGTYAMAAVAWLTVIVGTYVVYPWYRAAAPKGADLTEYPKAFLLSNPATAVLHSFGMEFKEHVAWIAPILATAVAYIVFKYGPTLADHPRIRQAAITLFTLAFAAAAFAGLYGALITKAAPVH